MIDPRYDFQLLLEGEDLDEDDINDYIRSHFEGEELLVVGDDELIKLHFHTNKPYEVLEYMMSLGEVYDIVVEDMDRQSIVRTLQLKSSKDLPTEGRSFVVFSFWQNK